MQNCVFCQIIEGKLPAEIFYEDSHCLAFPNLSPVVTGHLMVIPKIHSENFLDIDPDELTSLAVSSQEVAHKMLAKYKSEAFNLLMANGKDAQQSIFHFHWHLVPRYPNDGLDLWIKQKL